MQDNNMDPSSEPFCLPAMANHPDHKWGQSSRELPQLARWRLVEFGGAWVSDAGIEIQHYLTCDGFNAMLPNQYGFLTLRNWRVWGEKAKKKTSARPLHGQLRRTKRLGRLVDRQHQCD